jgi:hypothetical protein
VSTEFPFEHGGQAVQLGGQRLVRHYQLRMPAIDASQVKETETMLLRPLDCASFDSNVRLKTPVLAIPAGEAVGNRVAECGNPNCGKRAALVTGKEQLGPSFVVQSLPMKVQV